MATRRRRRLSPDEVIIGQLDIFGTEVTDEPATVIPITRGYKVPKLGEARYYPLAGRLACDMCFAEQAAASRAGLPIPRRRHARWRREVGEPNGTTVTYACQGHAQVLRSLDSAR